MRSLILGIVIAIFYLIANKKKFLLAIPLLVALFFVKLNSSLGRLFIYKISHNIFSDNWLLGIGIGKFKQQYNLYQANYFKSHSIDSKEALLADNTHYAFNDSYQLLIELGVIKALLLALLVFAFYKFSVVKPKRETKVLRFIHASFICILVSSLFNYALQVHYVQFIILILLGVYLYCLNFYIHFKNNQIKINIFLNVLFITGILLFSVYSFSKYNYKNNLSIAQEYVKLGYSNKAIEIFKNLETSFYQNDQAKMDYITTLYKVNKLKDAREKIEILKKQISFNELYSLSAKIYLEQKNVKKAEEELLMESYMVPNRMVKRYDLLSFYLSQKDTLKAKFWANSILNMPVKVKSQITDATLLKTKEILNGLK